MTFRGFPDEAFQFYDGLARDNSRAYWQANKATYEASVRGPMLALLEELDDHGPFHVFRPHRDVRFSKDKTPYKDHLGAYGESEGGAGFYVQFSGRGLIVGSGYYQMAADQLVRFRDALDADALGGEIVRIGTQLERADFELGAIDALKTAPRGFAKDHPRIEYLRRKGLIATRAWPPAAWMGSRQVIRRVRDTWSSAAEMNRWLDTHVGPSTMAPDEDELARFGPM